MQAGRHEFDGQMPDLSAAGIATEVARLRKLRAEAQGLDTEAMTPPERFEREHLYTVIDSELFWLDRARLPFTNPAWYIEQLDPDVYLNRAYAPLAKRLQGYIGYARAIPGIAADIRANLKTPLPQSFVERGIGAFGGFAIFYRKRRRAGVRRGRGSGRATGAGRRPMRPPPRRWRSSRAGSRASGGTRPRTSPWANRCFWRC